MRIHALWLSASVLTLAGLPVLVAACTSSKPIGPMTAGAVTGSVPHATISNTATNPIPVGSRSVIGGIGGSKLGFELGAEDRLAAANAEYRALEYGQSGAPVEWQDRSTSRHGSIVPDKPYKQGSRYCRAYIHTVYVAGGPETAKGTACRDADGTWRSLS